MLTIENIEKLCWDGFKTKQLLRVAGEKWELTNIQTVSDVYQFVFRCIEAHPAGGLFREVVINLSRVHIAGTIGNPSIKTYKLNNISNGVTHFVNKNDLKAPGLLIGPMLRLIEGC